MTERVRDTYVHEEEEKKTKERDDDNLSLTNNIHIAYMMAVGDVFYSLSQEIDKDKVYFFC
jgi:hypothetical protein